MHRKGIGISWVVWEQRFLWILGRDIEEISLITPILVRCIIDDPNLSQGKCSYYTEWNRIEVMYHISQLLNSEEHRRLIGMPQICSLTNNPGNDVVFIIYHDSDEPFDPTPLDGIGTVPQVFLVVKPVGNRFRLGVFARPNIRVFDPPTSSSLSYAAEYIKDIILVKAFNGFAMSRSCPPMCRLFERPRAAAIADIVKEFLDTHKKQSVMIKQQRTDKAIQNIKADITLRNSTQIVFTCRLGIDLSH